MQVVGQSETVYALNVLLGAVVIVVVDDAAHSDVRAYPQCLGQRHHAVSAASPVMVLHFAAVHGPYAASGVHGVCGVYYSVVECNHY